MFGYLYICRVSLRGRQLNFKALTRNRFTVQFLIFTHPLMTEDERKAEENTPDLFCLRAENSSCSKRRIEEQLKDKKYTLTTSLNTYLYEYHQEEGWLAHRS